METTTIAITKNVKERIIEFGNKGETYSEILEKLLKGARERQIHDLLMDEDGTISIEEALTHAKKKWQK
jgi:predicted CopG family antitoxin